MSFFCQTPTTPLNIEKKLHLFFFTTFFRGWDRDARFQKNNLFVIFFFFLPPQILQLWFNMRLFFQGPLPRYFFFIMGKHYGQF